MKLSKLFKGILCASLLMGGMAIMPNKTDAVEIEPYAIVREIKVNKREKVYVQLSGLESQFVYVDLYGSYILANGIIILDEKDIESYMNGSLVFYLENTTME